MRTFVSLLASLASLASIAGCSLSDGAPPPEDDLEAHREMFARVNRTSYAFTWKRGCFCTEESTFPIRIKVAGQSIVSAVYVDGGQPVSDLVRDSLETIDGVFDMIEDSLDQRVDELTVTYDPTHDYPTSVFIDRERNATDDELSLELSAFISPADVP